MATLPGSFAVMGDVQWLPGYCVLLADRPDIGVLNDLDLEAWREFLIRMAMLGEAVAQACRAADSAFRRVNLGQDDLGAGSRRSERRGRVGPHNQLPMLGGGQSDHTGKR